MTEHPETPDAETERRIRTALSARADDVRISPDALDRIRRRGSRNPWGRPLVYAAAAVLVVVLVGVAVLTRPDDEGADVDRADDPATTAPPSTSPPPSTTAPPSTTPPSTTTIEPLPTPPSPGPVAADSLAFPLVDDPVEVARAGLQLFPTPEMSSVRTSPDEAARGWAQSVLGVEDPDLVRGPVTLVAASPWTGPVEVYVLHSPDETGARGRPVSTIVTASPDNGDTWEVTHVLTEDVRIGLVERNGDTGGVRVTGTGRGFEGTAVMTVGDLAESVILSVGSGSFDDFSVIVPEAGPEPLVVTVVGATGFDGEVPAVASFRAVPAEPRSDIVVFGVADDDVLNLRAGAGIDNEIVATIPPDGAGIVHTGLSTFVGADEWWQVVHDGTTGWANRRFLSVQLGEHGATRLDDRLVEGTMEAIGALQSATADAGPFAPRVEIGGIGVFADFPTPWRTIAREELDGPDHDWNPDPEQLDDRSCDCEMTVGGFLAVDTARWELAEYTFGPDVDPAADNWFWATGLPPDVHDRFTTVTVYLPEPNPQETLDWRRYTFLWEFEDGTPQVRGIWRWGWTP